MSQVVHQQLSEFWTTNQRLGKPMIFVFDDLRSMGTCIKLFTTISPNFCRRYENVEELKSYEQENSLSLPCILVGYKELLA